MSFRELVSSVRVASTSSRLLRAVPLRLYAGRTVHDDAVCSNPHGGSAEPANAAAPHFSLAHLRVDIDHGFALELAVLHEGGQIGLRQLFDANGGRSGGETANMLEG